MSSVEIIQTNKNIVLLGPSSFFFSDCRTLKLLKLKCNPTNKKKLSPNVMVNVQLLQELHQFATWGVETSSPTEKVL